MTKAEAIKVMDAVANFKYCMNDTPITMAMVSAAAAVAAKALRRSLNAHETRQEERDQAAEGCV